MLTLIFTTSKVVLCICTCVRLGTCRFDFCSYFAYSLVEHNLLEI